MSEKKLYSLNYFNKVGKINLIHLIFAACDVPYEENRIEKLTDSDIQQGFLPFLKVNQCEIPCISVISRFLAKDFGIAGESNIDQAKCDAISQLCMLLIDSYYRNVKDVEDLDTKKNNFTSYLENDLINSGKDIEHLVKTYCKKTSSGKESSGPCCDFSVGNKLTYADLHIYELVSKYFPDDSDDLPKLFPNLYNIKANVEKLPKIQKFIKSNKNQPKAISKNIDSCLKNQ